jgi:hypothetical protein
MKIQRACLSEASEVKDYRRRIEIDDPLFDMSIDRLRRTEHGRVGFNLIIHEAARFSAFMIQPEKSSRLLEEAMDNASETYAGQSISHFGVLFEGGGRPFVYSDWIPSEALLKTGVMIFRNHNRPRSVMFMPSFLRAFGLSQHEDE